MDCPKCGYPRAKYKQSRKEYWGGHKKGGRDQQAPKPRIDFKAKCKKCGHEWEEIPPDYVPTPEETTEEVEEDEVLGEEDVETNNYPEES